MVRVLSQQQTNKKVTIYRALLPISTCNFIETEDGKLSYIGQLLHQLQPGITTLVKGAPVRLVSDLKTPIPHFTRYCRGTIVQTDLCSAITDMKPSPENEQRIVDLLKDICEVSFE